MNKEILVINNGNDIHHFYGEICSFLDNCVEYYCEELVNEFRNVTYICNYTNDKSNLKLIRFPGATRGCIELDDNNIITNIQIYDDAFTGPAACYKEGYKDKIKERLDSYIGYRLIFLQTYEEISEEAYYKILKHDDLFLLKRLDKLYPALVWEAASYGAINILKYLVEDIGMNIDYDSPGTAKNTPFKQACAKCELETAKYLIEKGTNTSNLDIRIDWDRDESKLQTMTDYLDSLGLGYRVDNIGCTCCR